ncbi:FecR domain-containing protein [Rhizobium anhuiense]|uniref:FecR domain-containing protein n=1 Tax=Rhizobium anhuiense TaxID=1184720 RepID=UPI001FE1F5CE|nr:FecR domain-containing protein [Rhizobium anhuiense]
MAKASQQVNFTVDKRNWVAVRAGDIIPNTAWIATGPRGRVQLVRGVESISFQPNTVAGIFTSSFGERKTEVVEQAGVLDLEIEKRSKPHTTVQTPFLAAVVKGTNFRVSVSKSAAEVTVNRGLVQVTSFASGQRANVGPGQGASVDGVKGMTVSGDVSTPVVTAVAPSVARVPAVGATTLNGQAETESSKASGAPSSVSNSVGSGDRDSASHSFGNEGRNGNRYGADNGSSNGNENAAGNDDGQGNAVGNDSDNGDNNGIGSGKDKDKKDKKDKSDKKDKNKGKGNDDD